MDLWALSLAAGWIGLLCGTFSGAALGFWFHDDHWLGGYGSFRRRMLRLSHISFIGLGFLNIMNGLTLRELGIESNFAGLAVGGFLLGLATMPLCCLLAAWRKPLRHLFPVPVVAVLVGNLSLLALWWAK
ncbi:MAG: hypothetical protein ACYTG7_25260 [Planctomycetota bacterium]|jgi:hypothetical protein